MLLQPITWCATSTRRAQASLGISCEGSVRSRCSHDFSRSEDGERDAREKTDAYAVGDIEPVTVRTRAQDKDRLDRCDIGGDANFVEGNAGRWGRETDIQIGTGKSVPCTQC